MRRDSRGFCHTCGKLRQDFAKFAVLRYNRFMKKILVLLVMFLFAGYVSAEEIKLEAEQPIETNINLEMPDRNVMESCPQKLENNGILLQNTMTPVSGVRYDHPQVIPSVPTKPVVQQQETPVNTYEQTGTDPIVP